MNEAASVGMGDDTRIEELEKLLDMAIQALEFYADKSRWCEENPQYGDNQVTIGQNDWESFGESLQYFGGNMARETLAKIREARGE